MQAIQFVFNENTTIYCQANKIGAKGFYQKNHFELITKPSDVIIDHFGDTWINEDKPVEEKTLVLLKSRIRVNLLHPWIYEDAKDNEFFMKYLFPQLLKVYFPLISKYYYVDDKQFDAIMKCINNDFDIETIE